MKKSIKFLNRIGRVLFGLVFVLSGLSKIGEWNETLSYMEAHNLPFSSFLLIIAIVLLVFGGISILCNYKVKWGATLLLIFIVPATFIFHNFWSLPVETELELMIQKNEMVSFLKNIMLIGALLMMVSGQLAGLKEKKKEIKN